MGAKKGTTTKEKKKLGLTSMIFIALIIALNEWLYLGKTLPFELSVLSNVLLALTAVVAVISGVIYIVEAAKKINFLENK